MSKELAVSIVIGAVLKGSFDAIIGRSVTQFDRLGKTIGEVDAKARQIKTFRRLKSDLSQTETAWHKAKAKVAALKGEMHSAAKPTKAMRQALGSAHKEVHHLNERLNQQRQALIRQRRAMAEAGVSTSRLNAQETRLGATVDKLRQRYDKLGAAIKRRDAIGQKRSALRGQLIDAVALGAAIAAPARAALGFESVMADVKKVVDFDSPAQFKTLQKDLLKLSTVIPMSAEGLGDIMAAAGQAGIARHELLTFAKDAARMGVAFDMSGKEAGSAMTGLRSLFKLNQQQVVSLGDAYNHLSNNMDATASDMLNIAHRAGSTATLFGLSGQQVGALGATFLALKTRPEVAATGINALLLKLKAADKQGARFQDALVGMGIDAQMLKEAIEDDAQGALLDFLETVKSSDDVTGTLADLFGTEYADDMAKLVGGLDMYKKALGLVNGETRYASSMQQEYEQRAQTTANNLQLFRNQVTRLGVSIGSVLLPPLNTLLGGFGHVVGGLTTLTERFPTLTKGIVLLGASLMIGKIAAIAGGYALTFFTGALVSAKVAFHTLTAGMTLATLKLKAFNATALITATRTKALAVGGAIKGFATGLVALASRAIPIAIGALNALRLAVMTNPIGLIIGGIALAAGLILTYWQPIKGFFSGLWTGVKTIFSTAWQGIKTLLSFRPLGLIINAWGGLGGFFGQLFGGILNTARAALDWLLGKFEKVVGVIGKTWKAVTGWFGGDNESEGQTASRAPRPTTGIKPVALAATLAATPVTAQPVDAHLTGTSPAPSSADTEQRTPQITHYNNFHISLHQQPGQDAQALVNEMMAEIDRRQQQSQREGLHDGL